MKRRRFMRVLSAGTLSLGLLPLTRHSFLQAKDKFPQAVWVENGEPEALLARALQEFGGLQRFIKNGDVVVVKPNIAWDRPPELAATTNPQLVAAVVKACKDAGAKEVKVFDRTCNNPRRSYRSSKIAEYAKKAGAKVEQVRENRFKPLKINGKIISEWPIYEEYLKADKVINIPIAKQHSISGVTLGLKNLMGVMGDNRGLIHNNFEEKLTDIDRKILPTLTIIDAYRILTANGPVGGNPKDVKLTKTLILSDCTVSADYLALSLFGFTLNDVPHIQKAYEKGLAKYDRKKLTVRKVRLA